MSSVWIFLGPHFRISATKRMNSCSNRMLNCRNGPASSSVPGLLRKKYFPEIYFFSSRPVFAHQILSPKLPAYVRWCAFQELMNSTIPLTAQNPLKTRITVVGGVWFWIVIDGADFLSGKKYFPEIIFFPRSLFSHAKNRLQNCPLMCGSALFKSS